MAESAVVIVVLGYPAIHLKYYLGDPHQAVQDILLTAPGLGLGSCWMGVRDKPFEHDIRELLSIPDSL